MLGTTKAMEAVKVKEILGMWCVLLLSHATESWIVAAECETKEQAEQELVKFCE